METAYSEFHKRNMPVIRCTEDMSMKGGHVVGWKFKCPFCKKNHYHSVGEGQRVAHCTSNTSHYKTTGYYLKLEGVE